MHGYNIVMYMLQNPEKKLVVATRPSKHEARSVMRSMIGKGWILERRPDLHTWGDLVLTFEPVKH